MCFLGERKSLLRFHFFELREQQFFEGFLFPFQLGAVPLFSPLKKLKWKKDLPDRVPVLIQFFFYPCFV
ncbi:MAG TPA: hypothetical protein DGG95_02755 [Cytophagales bacterium]|nr:hypothetical protein [Cytophagales bacterium]